MDAKATLDGAAMSTITDAQNNQNSQTQKKTRAWNSRIWKN